MRYLPLLLVSVIYSQIDEQVLIDNDIQRVSEFKRDVAYGQDCDDTEYRDYKGSPAWKGYGGWLSECDSIRSVHLDREFTERAKQKQREKAIQDSIEMASVEDIDFDLDAMWENTVLYYRRSMKGIALVDLQKAYGKLKIKREKITNPKQLKKIDNLLSQLRIKIQNS